MQNELPGDLEGSLVPLTHAKQIAKRCHNSMCFVASALNIDSFVAPGSFLSHEVLKCSIETQPRALVL